MATAAGPAQAMRGYLLTGVPVLPPPVPKESPGEGLSEKAVSANPRPQTAAPSAPRGGEGQALRVRVGECT